eukprot:12033338-Alexandrium_andersonii.AAC.1
MPNKTLCPVFTMSGCSLCPHVRGPFTGVRAMQGRISGSRRTASEPPRRCLRRRCARCSLCPAVSGVPL